MTDRGQAGAAFEELVRAAAQAKGLSIESLANTSGIDRGRWYRYFRGTTVPGRRTLARVAPVLGLSADELVATWGDLIDPPHTPGSGASDGSGPGALLRQLQALIEQASNLTIAIAALASKDRPSDDPVQRWILELLERGPLGFEPDEEAGGDPPGASGQSGRRA